MQLTFMNRVLILYQLQKKMRDAAETKLWDTSVIAHIRKILFYASFLKKKISKKSLLS